MKATTPREIIGEIKKYMFINNISVNDLAAKLNTSTQNINNMFRRCNPSLFTLMQLIQALDATFDFEIKNNNDKKS